LFGREKSQKNIATDFTDLTTKISHKGTKTQRRFNQKYEYRNPKFSAGHLAVETNSNLLRRAQHGEWPKYKIQNELDTNWHEFIRRRFRWLRGFIATKTQRHEGTRICFSRLGVLGKLCSESKLSPQRLCFVHKAIAMAFFRSRLKT